MSRIEQTFKSLNRPALKIFLTAGDPDYDKSLALLKSAASAGADMIELGMPFSDPVADGPTVEAGGYRALRNGASMKKTLQIVRDFRKGNAATPLILMGYANPVLAYGLKEFVADTAEAGVDGVLIVDMPPEESDEILALLHAKKLDLIRLVTPTTDDKRLEKILQGASGFLYYVSITGVTGGAKPEPQLLKPRLDRIRKQTALPIAVGFGISTPEDVRVISPLCDAVVIGSALVKIIAEHENDENLIQKVSERIQDYASVLRK